MYREALRDILAKYPNIAVAAEAGERLEGLERDGGQTREKSRNELPTV